MYDGIEEISYIKEYTNIFTDPKFSEFFSIDVLRKQIEDEFNRKMKKYNRRDIFYNELKENLERKRDEDLETITAYENKKKRLRQNITILKKLIR